MKMTAKEFQRKARLLFLKRNPDASIGWLRAPRLVTYPTGITGWEWRFEASAPGYKAREMLARGDDKSILIN